MRAEACSCCEAPVPTGSALQKRAETNKQAKRQLGTFVEGKACVRETEFVCMHVCVCLCAQLDYLATRLLRAKQRCVHSVTRFSCNVSFLGGGQNC